MRAFDYWESGKGLDNITPPSNEWPEGPLFKQYYGDMLFGQDVVEFGCGTGRLAELFSKRRYLGVDICLKALARAHHLNPGYNFTLIDRTSPIETGHVLFAHTVLLHVPDEDLVDTVGRFRQRRIIVSEILGENWRRDGNPPVFNRSYGAYERAFNQVGYRMHRVQFKPYPHYAETDFAIMEFHRDS